MKKYIYILLGLAATLSACTQEIIEETPEVPEGTEIIENSEIPTYLVAQITDSPDSKTSYTSSGVFSWSASDKVDLLLHKPGATYIKLKAQKYDAVTISNDGKTATFKISDVDDTSLESGDGTPLDTWTSSHVAVYPQGMMSDHIDFECTYNTAFVKLPQSVTGEASSIILLGNPSNGTFKFRTAMAVLKVTVTDIPAQAAKLRLYTNKTSCPIDGDFAIADNANEIRLSDYLPAYGSAHDYIEVDLAEESAIPSRDFYFNIPTGEYPAGTLSIKLLDSNENALLEKTINKALSFERNDLVKAPGLANEWITLGTGRFIDNFLWAKIVAKGSVDKDVPGYVDVTVQQNVSNTNKFRLVDPYGAAATQFGYTSANAANRDEYLEFTVENTSTGSAVTGYTTHRTGFAIDGSNYNPEIVYPTTYDVGSSTAQNKVVVGDASLPKIVQFAPAYHYNGYAMNSSYTYPQAFDKKGVFRIMFPDATGYEGTLTPNASATAATLSPLAWTHESNAARIRMVISAFTDYEIAAPQVNSYYCGYYPSGTDAANDTSNSSWNASAKVTAASLSSGPAYLTWFTTDGSETVIYSQGRTKVYYISASDVTALCKQHSTTGNKGTSSDGEYTGSYTFAVCEDPTVGNIKMTEFDGLCCDVSEMAEEPASTHLIYSSLYWIAPGTTTYTGENPAFTDGTAQYGVLSGSSILLDASAPFFKRGSVNVYVYSYTDYAGSGRGTANTPIRFKFTVADGKVNVGETYVNARFDGNGQASAPYANTVVAD